MPERFIVTPPHLYLENYFSKFGFEDGNVPSLTAVAESLREEAIRFLNKELDKRGVKKYRAMAYDAASVHSNCRMVFEYCGPLPDDEDRWEYDISGFDADEMGVKAHLKASPAVIVKMRAAYKAAERKFNRQVVRFIEAHQESIDQFDSQYEDSVRLDEFPEPEPPEKDEPDQ